MNTDQKPDHGLIYLAILIAVATIAVAGCADAGHEQQDRVTPAGNQQGEHPAAATIKMTTAPAPLKTAEATLAPVLSSAAVTFDPIGDKKAGDPFTITGTTSLPTGTSLFWQIRKDTGTPPSGLDMSSTMGIMANNQVTKGDATANRVSLAVDTGKLVPGKYVVLVMKLKGDPLTVDPTTGTLAGYTCVTLT